MQHKITTGTEATKKINDLLNDNENRSRNIVLLGMQEVDLYIDTVNAMHADLRRKIEAGFVLMRSPTIEKIGKVGGVKYEGYGFRLMASNGPEDNIFRILHMQIEPTPPFQKYENLLIELRQRKRYLENLEKLEDKLIQKGSLSRFSKMMHHTLPSNESSKEEKTNLIEIESIEESIKDAQDQVAINALQSYHDLLNQHKELTEQFNKLKLTENHKATLLDEALSQNEKLQADMKALRSELSESTRENMRILDEKQKAEETIANAHVLIAEKKSELSRLKQAAVVSQIRRMDLVSLLAKFNYQAGFFDKEDAGLKNLKKLSEAKSEFISSQQIRASIHNPVLLQIFNNPHLYHNSTSLNRPELVIRELGFNMRYPDLPKISKP